MQFAPVYAFAGAVVGGFMSVSIKARYCAVCPGLHGVTLAGRILKLRDLKLREDGHLCVTTQPFRPFNRHQRSK